MSATSLTRPPLTERLHPVFDQQIMNYGAYNLVFATGRASRVDGQRDPERDAARNFLLGYRRAPSELVIAPMDPLRMLPVGQPVSIDNTNAVRLMRERHRLLAETTSGLRFILELNPLTEITTAYGAEVLEQEEDLADFFDFVGSTEQV